MDSRFALVVIVAIIVAIGWGAGIANLVVGHSNTDTWSSRDYVANKGDCFVPPQGDPLYDEHYAKNVNNPNCDAFKAQAQAKNIDAQTKNINAETRAVNAETTRGNFYTALLGFLLVCVIGFFAYVAFK